MADNRERELRASAQTVTDRFALLRWAKWAGIAAVVLFVVVVAFASFFSVLPWLQSVSGAVFGPAFVAFFRELSWQWPSPIGIVVTLAVGFGASAMLRRPVNNEPPLTFAEVMKRPAPPTAEPALASQKT